jgi:hypothetical protein
VSQENLDYVKCQLCGFEGKMLNRHLFKHSITAEEYRERFPGHRVACKSVMERQAGAVASTWDAKPKIVKPVEEYVCQYCGGKFRYRFNLKKHLKQEASLFLTGVEGEDFVVCCICGLRAESLESHVRAVHSSEVSFTDYKIRYGDKTSSVRHKKTVSNALIGKNVVQIEKRSGAIFCDKCGEWYLKRFNAKHTEECVSSHPDKYVERQDYVRCPECSKAMTRLGEHLKEVHGWDDDRIVIETGRGLKLISSKVVEKRAKSVDFEAAQVKREQTHLERHGFANPFADPATKEKIIGTNQRRYGADHPMQNEEVFTRQTESAQRGPSGQEIFFDEHTCDNVVYCGNGIRFIRTKVGVHKYSRIIKDLNPDFIVLPDNVLESARAASKEGRRLDRQKHRSRYVIELLGDWYHSKEVIGVDSVEHEKEIIEAYRSAGIECLVLWEKDVMNRWELIRPMVDAWIDRAVADMNEHPIFSRATKDKVDRRVGVFVCPYGSGRRFKTQDKLTKWMLDPLNFWRPEMVEGRDYVKCLECQNVRVGKVAEHLRQSHSGMTKDDYLAKYPGALMKADRVSNGR